jgi:hypothetical protein
MIEAANSNRFGVKCFRISKGLLETKGTVKFLKELLSVVLTKAYLMVRL